MAVQLIDHVKEEPVQLKSEQFKSGHFLQVTEDLKLCVGSQVSDSGNVLTFREFTAMSEDFTDGQCGDCLVSIQFDRHGANYVVCPYRKRATWETTLQLRVKKVKLEDTVNRKAERVDNKCRIYWFKLKSSKSGACVYESLAYKDFYVSIEGETVLLRKCAHGIPQTENFQIGVFPIHKFSETYHRVTTEERREMVNGETRSIAVTHEDDRLFTSGAYVLGDRGDVQLTDLHATEIKHTEVYEGKCVSEKSRHSDTTDIEQNVPVDKSPEIRSPDSPEMSSASSPAQSVCRGAQPSTVSYGSSVMHEETSFSIKSTNIRSTPPSLTEHSSGADKVSASGCDLSSASPPKTPEVMATERTTPSVTEVEINVDDFANNTHSPKHAPTARDITNEVRKDGDSSRELTKDSEKISAKKEKKRKRRFALSRIFSCVSSRSAD
ncbi:uncharacterized protein [Haliotis asinina]|uniref:uncharacterized protein n=1 Tax=Haliotis asinina TaxID=109174 RepID=UPI003531F414